MKRFLPEERTLVRCEFAAAILVTLFLIFLHLRLLMHAGPLWRDEINSLYVANTQTFHEFTTALVFNPFPALFAAVLRIWIALGFGNSDFHLRILGFVIGLSLIGAIWLSCRWIDKRWSAPLWPLTIFAARAMTISDGDSLRPYGLGMICVVLTFGLIWKLAFEPNRIGTVVLAAIAALFSVQSLYLNAFVVFGICLAGIVVAIKRREFQRATVIFFIGVIGAASLLPYRPVMQRARELWPLQREEHDVLDTVHSYEWLVFVACGLALIVVPWAARRLAYSLGSRSDRILFSLVAVAIAATATFAFLWTSGVPGSRHLLPVVAGVSLSVHSFAGLWQRNMGLRVLSLLGIFTLVAALAPTAYLWSGLRRTDCDLAATAIAERANESDFAIVMRFTHAITFERYYHGAADWKSVPDMADHQQHRWDLAREAMVHVDPIRDILVDIESALESGHKVFLVGRFPAAEPDPPSPLPPAPQSKHGWRLFAYLNNWHQQIAYLLRNHAVEIEQVALTQKQSVDLREHEEVFVFSGWRD
jgi:uncharacterized protein YjeT (DUF2065 family)